MTSRRRALGAALLLLAPHAFAAPFPGIDYRELQSPQPTATAAVEVVEFFWYRCPHCYEYEPHVRAWQKRLPSDVIIRQVPVVFNDDWAIDAGVFYALQDLGEEARLRQSFFDAVHQDGGRKLRGKAYAQWVAAWLAGQGLDPARYQAALDSPRVQDRIVEARRMTKAYAVAGTPTFVVQGRYVVTPETGERPAVLEVLQYLVDRARSTRH